MVPVSTGMLFSAWLLNVSFVLGPVLAWWQWSGHSSGSTALAPTAIILVLLPLLLNSALSIARGQSLGKKVMELSLQGVSGEPVSSGVRARRCLLGLLPLPLLYFRPSLLVLLCLVDGALVLMRQDQRSLRDMMAGTRVVTPSSIPWSGQPWTVGADGKVAGLPWEWEALTEAEAPDLGTYQLIGRVLTDGVPIEPTGRLRVGTQCFVIFLVPINGTRRYLYSRNGRKFRFYAAGPVSRGWVVWNTLVLLLALASLAVIFLAIILP